MPINRIGSLVKINKQIVEDYEKVHHNFKTAMLQRIDKVKIKNSRIFVHGNNLFIYFEASNINDGMFMCSADKEQQKDNKISLSKIQQKIFKLGAKKIDYIKLLNINKLIKPYKKGNKYKIFISYYLGSVRLIDNI